MTQPPASVTTGLIPEKNLRSKIQGGIREVLGSFYGSLMAGKMTYIHLE